MRVASDLRQSPTGILEAIQLRLRELFTRYDALGGNDVRKKNRLLNKIRQELEVQMELEEALFYPAVRNSGADSVSRVIIEAIHDHLEIKAILEALTELSFDRRSLDPKMNALQERVLRHFEREESHVFSLSASLPAEAALELGNEMVELRDRLRRNHRRATRPLRERNLLYPTLEDRNGAPEDDRDAPLTLGLPGESNERHRSDFDNWGSE